MKNAPTIYPITAPNVEPSAPMSTISGIRCGCAIPRGIIARSIGSGIKLLSRTEMPKNARRALGPSQAAMRRWVIPGRVGVSISVCLSVISGSRDQMRAARISM